MSPSLRPKHRLPRGGSHCDFCGIPNIETLFSCRNFVWEDSPIFKQDLGRWAACWACSKFIKAEQWGQLTKRSMRQVAKRHGLTGLELRLLRDSLSQLHRLFSRNVVKGEALKIINMGQVIICEI